MRYSKSFSSVGLWYLFLIFVCVACWFVLQPKFLAAVSAQPSSLIPVPFILFVAYEIVVLVHHAARMVAARFIGMRLLAFSFGPLALHRVHGQMQISLNNRQNILAGNSAFAPRGLSRLRARCAWLIVAGPATTILFGILLLLLAQLPDPARFPVSTLFLGSLALVAVNLGVRLLLPLPISRSPSYGTLLADLAKGKPTVEVQLLVSALAFERQQGVRPRDWSPKMLDLALRLTEHGDNPDRATICFLAYYRMVDLAYPERAALFLDEAVAKVKSQSLSARVMLEKAFFEAFFRRDVEKANEAFEKVTDWSTTPHHNWLRVASAIALAEGNVEQSQRQAREALEIVNGLSVSPPLTLEWLRTLVGERVVGAEAVR
jgi:hypothetical protein